MRQPTPAEWTRINILFDRLLDAQPDQRETALGRSGEDDYVTGQVRAMLAAHATTGLLDAPIAAPGDTADTGAAYASLASGDVVGGFRILRLIGRGGMGEVYLAERDDARFAQRVALKLLRPEAAGRLTRFDAERRLLATLEHPGIARFIDGGLAPDGRPFMAIEYVEGSPVMAWCTAHGATLEQRLDLMLQLCDAVSHAHGHLIVHRDIKPGNIMVDQDGRARLLDFGIAKLIDDAAPDDATTQALLTPGYAAPEQFLREAPTVAADIYALGGVLYELLCGQAAWHREGGALPRALTRLVEGDPELPSKAAARRAEPPVPPTRIAGDLDAIVAKAMRHDPVARYASAASMADDLRRYLRFEPVAARKGTFGYQLRRLLRRHRGAAFASAAALIALLAGIAGITWQAHRAAVERDIAQSAARRAEAVNQAMSLMFRNAQDFGKGGEASAHDLLDDSAHRLIGSFGAHSPDTAPIVSALAELYLQIDDVAGAETLLSSAIAKGVGRDDPAARARLEMDLGTVEGATGKLDDAKRLLAAADAVWATDPERYRKERLEAVAAHAQILRQDGQRDAAIDLLRTSLPEAERVYADNPRVLLIRYNNLAVHLVEANRLAELNDVLGRAEALVRRLHLERSPAALNILQLRGGYYARKDQQAEALRTFQQTADIRRALFGPSRFLSADLLQVGRTQIGLGRLQDGERTLTEAQTMARQYAGISSPITTMIGISLGETYARLGKVDDAERAFAAIQPALKATGPASIFQGAYLRARAQLDEARRDFPAARSDLDRAEAIFIALGAPAEPYAKSIAGLRRDLDRKSRP